MVAEEIKKLIGYAKNPSPKQRDTHGTISSPPIGPDAVNSVMPDVCGIFFDKSLSIAIAEGITPECVYGIPVVSKTV